MTTLAPGSTGEPYSQVDYSSIPTWARPGGAREPIDLAAIGGAAVIVAAVGKPARVTLDDAIAGIGAYRVLARIVADDVATATKALRARLDTATVGVRVLVIGPAGAGLALRATALAAGLEDDEIHVAVVGTGAIEIFCSHCRVTTRVCSGVDDVVDCSGCARKLLVYYHISRRSGAYLGFQVDAEMPTSAAGSSEGDNL